MLGRIVRSADFERVLGIPACARSAHFAIHFLEGRPSRPSGRPARPAIGPEPFSTELSTVDAPSFAQPVDDFVMAAPLKPPEPTLQVWLGTVVPKRHAKRAVTRSLLKRLIRAALLRRETPAQAPLRSGLWVVRLRAPFDRTAFPGAASEALRDAASGELDAVIGQAARKLAGAPPLPRGAP